MTVDLSTKKQQYGSNVVSLKEPQKMSLGCELERQALANPGNNALLYEEQVVTYGELNERANQYANYFAGQGFKKGDVVALLMENRPAFLIAASGLSKLGVIVSLVNNGVRDEVLAHALSICDARALIVGHELLDAFIPISKQVKMLEPGTVYVETEARSIEMPADVVDINPILAESSSSNPVSTGEVNSEDVIVYIYTSGTTGLPKATAVKQKRWLILGNLTCILADMHEGVCQYMCLPLYHNSGFDIGYSSMLVSGSSMVIKRKFSARNFWSDVRKYNAEVFIYVGELCRYIYNQPELPDDAHNPLKFVMGNGMRADLMELIRKRYAIDHIIEAYGATEGVGSFINFTERPGMCGSLDLNGMRQGEIVKWDFENDKLLRDLNGWAIKCQKGETGLLLCELNNLNVFAGYVNNPQATQEKILHNVFREGDQYFDSGDLLQLHEDDYISFVDRLGDTYRWKSENVSTNQVSDVLIRFGGLEDANVYGIKIDDMEGRCGMAALKLLDGVTIDWDKFSTYVLEKLPSFAIPYFIRLRPEIDATNNFKQVKKQLQNEGFNPNTISDPLYFMDPRANKYVPLNPELYSDLIEHKVRF